MPIDKKIIEDIWGEIQQEDPYAKLGLERNPFPANGNPPASPTIAPYPEVNKQITQFVISFLRSKKSRGLVILGDYGTGKTYHLRWIRSLLESKPEVSIQILNIETPGLEPYHLVRSILAQIGDQEIAKAVWRLILPKLKEAISSQGQKFFQDFMSDKLTKRGSKSLPLESFGMDYEYVKVDPETFTDYRNFLSSFDKRGTLSREKLRDWALPLLYRNERDGGVAITTNAAIAKEIANLCFLSGVPALESWERLTVTSNEGIFPNQAEPEFLQTILRLLVLTGTQFFVLLLDEFEKVPLMENLTQREMKKYLDTVRMLADKSWEDDDLPFAWVIASHDEAWDQVSDKLNQALAERFPTEIHLPRTVEKDVSAYIIIQHLNLSRLDSSKTDTLLPFSENIMDLIPVELRRTPRDLLTLCYELIEASINVELVNDRIPESFILEFVRNYHGYQPIENQGG